ncbi:MAG: hypothetical protein ACKVOU_13680 [Cytophagales bacterium]
MSGRIKKERANGTKSGAYLTKRIIRTISKTSIKEAFDSSMAAMGYAIIAENGSLVKVKADGTKEVISEIKHKKRTTPIVLD